jgi:hypothetical protein
MSKKYNVNATLEVSVSYSFEAGNEEQYLQGIGQIEVIPYDEVKYIQMPDGRIVVLRIDQLEVVDSNVEVDDGED